MRGGRQDIGVDREKRRRKRKCGAKKSGGRKSAAARDTAPPCLLGDTNADTVLLDAGERLDGVAPALGAMRSAAIPAFSMRLRRPRRAAGNFQIDGMRTGRSIGIAEDFDIRFGIGLQVLDQRADLGLFGRCGSATSRSGRRCFHAVRPVARRRVAGAGTGRAPSPRVPPRWAGAVVRRGVRAAAVTRRRARLSYSSCRSGR